MSEMSACDLCGSNRQSLRYRFGALDVWKCGECGLVFLGKGAREQDPRVLYDTAYFTERGEYFLQQEDRDFQSLSGEHIESFRQGLDRIEAAGKCRGRLLDLGCAVGVFLALAKQRGWEVCGVDVSEFAAARARERCQAEVYAGELSEIRFPDASFDVVTMWDVVEHCARPASTLGEVHRILKDDGLLLMDTPNEASLIRTVAYGLYRLFGGRMVYPARMLYHPYHLYYFSEKTLRELARKCGFEVIELVRKPIPLQKGRGTRLERYLVKAFAAVERPLGMDYELLAILRKGRGSRPT